MDLKLDRYDARCEPPHSCAKIRERFLQRRLTLLVGVLQGEGGGGAILPGLGAEVVVEAGAGSHGLGVEISGERAVLCQGAKRVSTL